VESAIAKAVGMSLQPVAVLFSEQRPEGAMQFAEGRWGCVMWLLASAAKGKAACADAATFGCVGGGVGLGFGNQYLNWPGGIECFYGFLSTGNDDSEHGRAVADSLGAGWRRESVEHFRHGEGYVKAPELTREFVDALPITEVPKRYVVMKPLAQVADEETPEVVVFLVDPDRLAALVVLANHAGGGNENVIIPWAAGCQTVGIIPYREARSERPRAVVGLTDPSARLYISKLVGRGLMTFTAPFTMYETMERNVAGRSLERDTWRALLADAAGCLPLDASASQLGQRGGMLAAVAAFTMWGLFPLYWKALAAVPAIEVVAHRTAWGFVAVAAWVTLRRGWRQVLTVVSRRRTLLVLLVTATLIACNWSLYIWSVVNGHVVESSLGYYINPLVNVVLGVLVLRERLGRLQRVAVGLAAIGVAVLTVGHGRFPWIALGLAVTFAFYGLLRKTVAADAVTGLLVETAILTPVATGYLALLAAAGGGALGRAAPHVSTLLVLGGVVTVVPLVLFAVGARLLPLSTVGMIQYISPSCQFLLAVLLYREPFTAAHAVAFACIWMALALLTWDLRSRLLAVRRLEVEPVSPPSSRPA